MRKLLSILILFFPFTIQAQVSDTLTAAGSTVTGGDGTGYIASYSWTTIGTPPASVVYSNPSGITTKATFSVSGDYYTLLTLTDNLGNHATTIDTTTYLSKQAVFARTSKCYETSSNSRRKQIRLDGTASYITGGNGYIKSYQWYRNSKVISNSAVTNVSISIYASVTWTLKVTDNLGDTDTATFSITGN